MSACNASRLRAVSLSVSPFVRLEFVAEILITSALNRNAANSNEVRVRVLGSTKKLTSVLPRRAGTFLISRVPTCLNASAVSRTKLISSADKSRRPRRSLRVQRAVMIRTSTVAALPGDCAVTFILFLARRHPVRCRSLAGAPESVRESRSANFFRRNRDESAARDGHDLPVQRAECARDDRTNLRRPSPHARCDRYKGHHR